MRSLAKVNWKVWREQSEGSLHPHHVGPSKAPLKGWLLVYKQWEPLQVFEQECAVTKCFRKINLMYQGTRRGRQALPQHLFLPGFLCPSNAPSSLLSYFCFLLTPYREAPPGLRTRSPSPPRGSFRSEEPAAITLRLLRSQPGPPPSTPMMSSSSRPSPAATCGVGRCVQAPSLRAHLAQGGSLWLNRPSCLEPCPLLRSSGSGHAQILGLCLSQSPIVCLWPPLSIPVLVCLYVLGSLSLSLCLSLLLQLPL